MEKCLRLISLHAVRKLIKNRLKMTRKRANKVKLLKKTIHIISNNKYFCIGYILTCCNRCLFTFSFDLQGRPKQRAITKAKRMDVENPQSDSKPQRTSCKFNHSHVKVLFSKTWYFRFQRKLLPCFVFVSTLLFHFASLSTSTCISINNVHNVRNCIS